MNRERTTDRRVEAAVSEYLENVPQQLVDQSRSLLSTRQYAGPGVLLARTVDAVTTANDVPTIGPAIAAVEFLDAYRITRNALCWDTDEDRMADFDESALLLMGDFLHALAFEAIGEMDCAPEMVIDGYRETVRGSLQSTAGWHERMIQNATTEPPSNHTNPSVKPPGFGSVAGRIGAQIAGASRETCERCASIGERYDRAIGLKLRSIASDHRTEEDVMDDVPPGDPTEALDRTIDGGLDLIDNIDVEGDRQGLRNLFSALKR